MSGEVDLLIDPDEALGHAQDHVEAADDLQGVLNGIVPVAEAGMAATLVQALLERVMTESQAIVDTHSVVGGIVAGIARDTTLTDEQVSEEFAGFDEELLGL
ncbi:hypothetical protein [Serinibacter arcticus]|uniref:Uncharacterized protein n=1 Tax=Serinibacter arcticus TaxID=1655435 RepID=A0A4Z1E036_9MICO|nr:hypothetical protein [Serinibacter arcticus]TGO05264.1 hypothetical protein SERN_1268 [Serinibacter arcticus]